MVFPPYPREMVEVMCMQREQDLKLVHFEVHVSVAGRLVNLVAIHVDECPTSNGVDLIFSMTQTVGLEPID